MSYDFDNVTRGVRECPKCHFTMEHLRHSPFLDANGGYILDKGVRWDPDDHVATSFLFGSLSRFFWRHVGEPVVGQIISSLRNRYYRRILRRHPCLRAL